MATSLNDSQQTEPCPTPLAWQEVVQSFHETAVSRVLCSPDAETTVTEFGTGRPLVFLPALSGNHLLFTLTAWLLKDEFRTVLIDHPSWSRRPHPRRLIEQTAEIYALAVEHSCRDGTDLYAPSFGGQVALRLMAAHPRLVHRAVLQGAWPVRRLTWTERAMLSVGRLMPGPVRRAPLWLRTQLQNHRRWFPPFDETRFGFLVGENGDTPLRDAADRLLASELTDLTPALASIRQPILLLRCEGDGPLIQAAEDRLEAGLPRVTSETMPLAGHFPYLTHPHRLVKILRSFFGDQRSAISHQIVDF